MKTAILTLTFLTAISSYAAPPEVSSGSAVRETFHESPVAESPEQPEARLTKNWGGARTRLSDAGVDVGVIYKLDWNSVRSGGTEQNSEFLGNFDLRASFDLQKLLNWKGANFFVYVLGNHGGDPTENVGDIQGTSNIETPANTVKLYEAWLEQVAFNGTTSFLLGLHDLNSEFYVTPASGLFLNSSFGVGAELALTGANGPSIFPTTAPAFRVRIEPMEKFYFQSALFGAVAGNPDKPHGTHISWQASDGFLFINELAYHAGYEEASEHKELPMKFAIGAWTYTVPVQPVAGDEDSEKVGDFGLYLISEAALSSGLSSFARYGLTNGKANTLASNLSAGFNLSGLFGRDQDIFGLAVTRVGLSRDFRTVSATSGTILASTETTWELTYRAQLVPGIVLQPDLQYVVNPGGDTSLDNAAVLAARLEISL